MSGTRDVPCAAKCGAIIRGLRDSDPPGQVCSTACLSMVQLRERRAKATRSLCGFAPTGPPASDGWQADEGGPGRLRHRYPPTGRTIGPDGPGPVCTCEGFNEGVYTTSSTLDANTYGTCQDPKGYSAYLYRAGLDR